MLKTNQYHMEKVEDVGLNNEDKISKILVGREFNTKFLPLSFIH